MTDIDATLDAAARALERAEALVICAGACMGRDSGLPDHRGSSGFWRKYPALQAVGLTPAKLMRADRFADAPT